jgi:hypothetical protein
MAPVLQEKVPVPAVGAFAGPLPAKAGAAPTSVKEPTAASAPAFHLFVLKFTTSSLLSCCGV